MTGYEERDGAIKDTFLRESIAKERVLPRMDVMGEKGAEVLVGGLMFDDQLGFFLLISVTSRM